MQVPRCLPWNLTPLPRGRAHPHQKTASSSAEHGHPRFPGLLFLSGIWKVVEWKAYFSAGSPLGKAAWKPGSLKSTVRIIQLYCPLQIHRLVGVKKPWQWVQFIPHSVPAGIPHAPRERLTCIVFWKVSQNLTASLRKPPRAPGRTGLHLREISCSIAPWRPRLSLVLFVLKVKNGCLLYCLIHWASVSLEELWNLH